MLIKRAGPYAVADVARRMRARDFIEFTAVYPVATREQLAEKLVENYGRRDDVICAWRSGVPVAIGGLIETAPGVASLLFYATDDLPKIGLRLTRFIRYTLFPAWFRGGFDTIQCASLAGYGPVHKWLRVLGLVERGRMCGAGVNGEDFVVFSKVRDVRPTGA